MKIKNMRKMALNMQICVIYLKHIKESIKYRILLQNKLAASYY